MNHPLQLRDVTVSVQGRALLRNVDLSLPAGTVTGVIGPNGAGKSTLLSVAAGHQRPSRGSVLLGGRDTHRIPAAEAARRRAVMTQESSVAFAFTVREVVEMGRTPWRRLPVDDDAAVRHALELTELAQLAEREVTTLSGGERQRAALARVVAQASPVVHGSVVLLDEPTSAMDVAHAESTLRLARDLAAQGAAVGVVLHDLDAAAAYADELVLLDHGAIRAHGPVEKVCEASLLSEVYGTSVEVVEAGGRLRVGPTRPARVARPAHPAHAA